MGSLSVVALLSGFVAAAAGCALSHEAAPTEDGTIGDGIGRDGGPSSRDFGPRGDFGRADVDGGPIHGDRDYGPADPDFGPGEDPADPEVFDDEVERYVELERRARQRWCPCRWAETGYATEAECLEQMIYARECFREAVAGPPKNADLAALRCFNDGAEAVLFPCAAALEDDCAVWEMCGWEFRPVIEECRLTDAVSMCFGYADRRL